jgi:uncharacterized protein (DUF305 family)
VPGGARLGPVLLICVAAASCRSIAGGSSPPIVRPGAPGEPSRIVAPSDAADLSSVRFTNADVKFMQGMIAHHAQAVEMTGLLKTRTNSEEMKKLALRIELSQADEIRMMERWLRDRRAEVPDPHASHMHGEMPMPGLLTEAQMRQLGAARGADFDRLFLEDMIRHHDGALVMVKDLLATPGAAQDSDIFTFISDIDADQRMEMERMGAMLKELVK